MTVTWLMLLALGMSVLPLWLLGRGDAKRVRSRRCGGALTAGRRRVYVALVLLPAPLLALLVGGAALLLWLAGVLLAGWLCALLLSVRG